MCHAYPVSLGQTFKKGDGNLLLLDFSDDIQHRKAKTWQSPDNSNNTGKPQSFLSIDRIAVEYSFSVKTNWMTFQSLSVSKEQWKERKASGSSAIKRGATVDQKRDDWIYVLLQRWDLIVNPKPENCTESLVNVTFWCCSVVYKWIQNKIETNEKPLQEKLFFVDSLQQNFSTYRVQLALSFCKLRS